LTSKPFEVEILQVNAVQFDDTAGRVVEAFDERNDG
jgi:hypothetical protein